MSRAMNLYMPLFMGYLAYTFSSGLALYFVTSNLAGILQYGLMGRLDWRNVIPESLVNLLPGQKEVEEPAKKSPKKKASK